MMVYYEFLDPLYHETKFANEIMRVQDCVKQALYALKNAETHVQWKNGDGVPWRDFHLKLPKARNEYDFWMQKVHDKMGDSAPMFSDYPGERCLDINAFFMYNFFAPLRMNLHKRYNAEDDEWEVGWIMDPDKLISWTTVKFIHFFDQKIQLIVGKVQWQEILKSTTNFGYGDVFGELNEFVYNKVSQYIIEERLDVDDCELINSVTYAEPAEPAEPPVD